MLLGDRTRASYAVKSRRPPVDILAEAKELAKNNAIAVASVTIGGPERCCTASRI